MAYQQLKQALGMESAQRLEDAVLIALAAARDNGEAGEQMLCTMLMALAGAVIWSRPDNHERLDDIVQQCCGDLQRALEALRADAAPRLVRN